MKKVLLTGTILVSLSLSVTSVTSAIATELKTVGAVKLSVEPVGQEASAVELKDSPIDVVKRVAVSDTIPFKPMFNFTGENISFKRRFNNSEPVNEAFILSPLMRRLKAVADSN